MKSNQVDKTKFEFAKESTDFFNRVCTLMLFEEFEIISYKPNGFNGEYDPEQIYGLIKFCNEHPNYHVVSNIGSSYYNCYLPNAEIYFLANGDSNPCLAYDFGPITIADVLRIAEFYKGQ